MTRVFRSMYLRPGNLWKDFHLLRMKSSNVEGRKIDHFVDTAEMVRGVVAEASTDERERTKHLWDQDQHSLTHTIVVSGRCGARKGDLLTKGETAYLVLVTDDVGDLGGVTMLYVEQRNDIKGLM